MIGVTVFDYFFVKSIKKDLEKLTTLEGPRST